MSDNSKEAVEKVLMGIVAELAEMSSGTIRPTDRLSEDLGFDSIKRMETLSRISDAYGIEPDIDEVIDLTTVASIAEYLAAKLAGS